MFNTDYKAITRDIIVFIQNTFSQTGFERVVVGLSGGVDSSTTCYLLQQALGADALFPAYLPYGNLHMQMENDVQKVISDLKLPEKHFFKHNIQESVDKIASHDVTLSDVRRGNIMARVRMTYLYDLAKKHGAIVSGTENKSEHLLGYFTRYGDGASDFEPIRHLYKTQIFGLASFLNVPTSIVTKKPSAGLWSGQTDEEELGFSYGDADKVLYLTFEKNMSKKDIVSLLHLDEKIIDKILRRVYNNAFKQTTLEIEA